MTVLLDSHVLHWWSAEPSRVSARAAQAIQAADEVAVADITWFELAWLARHGRIALSTSLIDWLKQLASQVRTVPVSPAIATRAVELPASFPGDPADRLIYATALDLNCPLITKDRRMRGHRHPKRVALW